MPEGPSPLENSKPTLLAVVDPYMTACRIHPLGLRPPPHAKPVSTNKTFNIKSIFTGCIPQVLLALV